MSRRVLYIGAPEADAGRFAERVRGDFKNVDLFATNDREVALRHVPRAEAIIGHHFQFDEDLLSSATELRWIQSLTTGTDAILKLRSLRSNVMVTSTRGMHGPQMSELVFLQMLALLRDFPRMLRNQQSGTWERWPQPLLLGKTVGIVGVGAIAESLAPRCRAFGMRVIGVSTSTRVPAGFDEVVGRQDLEQVAATVDFLVLSVPYSPSTESLVGARVLGAMKPGAFLINVARGGVLDEEALLAALRSGRLGGAALDVFRQTPLPADDPIWREPRLIVTPQIGGMSDIYLEQAYPVVRKNLEAFLADRPDEMVNLVAH